MYKFIDLFSGCGGLSLGLSMAGLEGQFAIERDRMAFETFSENFLGKRTLPVPRFAWPSWLAQKAWAIDDLLAEHRPKLGKLRGKIDVLAGGPPCQGFSFAGKRQESDPRNLLFEKYVQVVSEIQPSALILENVPGMLVAHKAAAGSKTPGHQSSESFYEKLKKKLEDIGYDVHGMILDASNFGVPQKRPRLIVVGLRKELAARLSGGIKTFFTILEKERKRQLYTLQLPDVVSAAEAISDLRIAKAMRKPCVDPYSPSGFEEAIYRGTDPKAKTAYQSWAHRNCSNDEMDSMRLARHSDEVRERFARILKECRPGVTMAASDRQKFGLKKHRIHPMSSEMPAPTITTLPDDVLHYSEPRILTVRESARLQSFPDWFRFSGKFTTGGAMRTKECPRYTQVGNAVPPLLGRAIGFAIQTVLNEMGASEQSLATESEPLQKRKLAVA